jgi:hypothetical protein
MKSGLFLLAFGILLSLGPPAFAQDDEEQIPEPITAEKPAQGIDPNRDLVIPADNANDDAVISRDTISNKEAQKRQTPQDEGSHLRLVPFAAGDDKEPILQEKQKKGVHIYKTTPSPISRSAGIHVGPITPTNLSGKIDGITYKNVYGNATPFLVGFDYEFLLFQEAGKFGLRPALGFFTASGQGRFRSTPSLQADEIISLYAFPTSLSATYHLQFWDRQILVPFGEAGGDYIGFMEYRPDKEKFQDATRFGGATAWHWAAGLQLQLDFLNREGLWQLDSEYGINHIYLVGDVRQIIGLSTPYDFTALVYEGGFLFEF